MSEEKWEHNREDFLKRLKEGDEDAYRTLLQELEEPLISFLYRYVQNRIVAEELFSETMARVVQNIDSFEPRAKLSTWIFTIARNLAYDHLKSARTKTTSNIGRQQEGGEDNIIYLHEMILSESRSPEDRVEQREKENQIQQLISRIDLANREALLLRYYEQMTYKEVAEILDIPVGTAKYRVHRAVKQLEQLWSTHRSNPTDSDNHNHESGA